LVGESFQEQGVEFIYSIAAWIRDTPLGSKYFRFYADRLRVELRRKEWHSDLSGGPTGFWVVGESLIYRGVDLFALL
jgi:hypothetical protein